ncbi:ABC transporter substrate-binding protein [Shinella sumterensis]|uniref:ABC transporter substrate-binding protein n=1 Tax=Shinella sumterensis TaxID=1967501 RepID=UPI003F844376
MTKRALALLAFLLLAALPVRAEVQYPLTVTDSFGREVTIPAAPKAILLGTGLDLVALSLIHPDPVSLLAGWAGDMKGDKSGLYARFKEKFPAIETVPVIGDGISVSFEALLSLNADLAILANWQADTDAGRQAIGFLEQAGVPVIVVDFNSDALENTARNMRFLGRVLNREEQANAFADFYEARVKRIRDLAAANSERGPTVFMDGLPNPDKCCFAFGTGGLGEFLAITGSRNIAADLPRQGGTVSAEFVIGADPDVYIATALPDGAYTSLTVGPGVDPERARETLARLVEAPHLVSLRAVREGRVHALWNFFNAVPLNIVAAEFFAQRLRPDVFPDVDPAATLKEINARFAAVPFDGAYWIDLKPN